VSQVYGFSYVNFDFSFNSFSACDYNTACKCSTGLLQGQYHGKQL
ncbi:7860_t:CDS:1, partial [Dentiscutata erythropus]